MRTGCGHSLHRQANLPLDGRLDEFWQQYVYGKVEAYARLLWPSVTSVSCHRWTLFRIRRCGHNQGCQRLPLPLNLRRADLTKRGLGFLNAMVMPERGSLVGESVPRCTVPRAALTAQSRLR